MGLILKILSACVVFYGAYAFSRTLPGHLWAYVIPSVALLILVAIFLKERLGYRRIAKSYFGASIGVLIGFVIAAFLSSVLKAIIPDGWMYLSLVVYVILGYLGYSVGMEKGGLYGVEDTSRQVGDTQNAPCNIKILDTSVIIDGRIPDICDAGFIEGVLLVPQFILNELQHIADASDPLKRARGRRGLDVLKRLKKHPHVEVEITDRDFPRIKQVDSKLIALAKELGATILTNDYNLNKVAQIQGVNVLNINQLADAVKPIVLPGESIKVSITKEGREKGQGVAYLEDGTMVVIEGGELLLGKEVTVVVTSILQTPAGRMIFAAPKNGSS